ncbi:hypothetical protein CDL15_Pgr002699 [Punica granatum]|uniref:Uncharacterized protein n=1 Tax=Punica granatum TaxID=22663 RepID=A0A218Y1M2_PUNGR|nr:hypothetical protein CDL15_Pgr002699 [Punica granatum]
MGPTAQPSQATKPRLNPKPRLNHSSRSSAAIHSSAKPSHQAAAQPQATAQSLKPQLSRNKPRLAPMAGGSIPSLFPPPHNSNLLHTHHPSITSHHSYPWFPYTLSDISPSLIPLENSTAL